MLDTALLWYGSYSKQVNICVGILLFYTLYLSFWSRNNIANKQEPHIQPLHKTDSILNESEQFQMILSKNVSTLNQGEFSFFLSYKEKQYRERQRKIKEYCAIKGPKFGKKVLKNSLIYDNKDKVGYCQIAKVASSTWCNHFIHLGRKFRVLD